MSACVKKKKKERKNSLGLVKPHSLAVVTKLNKSCMFVEQKKETSNKNHPQWASWLVEVSFSLKMSQGRDCRKNLDEIREILQCRWCILIDVNSASCDKGPCLL